MSASTSPGPSLRDERQGPRDEGRGQRRAQSRGYYVVADEDTVLGFRYAGVPGEAVEGAEQARRVFDRVCRSGKYDIVILTGEVAATIRDVVNHIRFEVQTPVVVEVPGPSGPLPGRPDLLKLIQEAVGLRL
jgi:vacuolar-type H+-ATPase subunit F/Vma7